VSVAYLDTHAAVFLHDGLTEDLSIEAKRLIEANDLLISPMVLLELDYLYQRKRIGVAAKLLFATLNTDFGVSICRFPFPAIALEAVDIGWTMDPFDRLIVAHAIANHRSVLVTKDRLIRRNYHNARW
jgi:PIN domain nuclease of toxin-antitoxin system